MSEESRQEEEHFADVLEDKLGRIRVHVQSKLPHQKKLAIILIAVEESLKDENENATDSLNGAYYFLSFLSLLDKAFASPLSVDHDLASSATYFLNIIMPFVPKGLLKSKFSTMLPQIAYALTYSEAEPQFLRSSIGCLQYLLEAQDASAWSDKSGGARSAIRGLMKIGLDPRPKVRKRALEALTAVLRHIPPSPSRLHPANDMCVDVALTTLENAGREIKKSDEESAKQQVIHSIQLLKAVTSAGGFPESKIGTLCSTLFSLCRSSDQRIVLVAFDAFESTFRNIPDDSDSSDLISKIVDSVMKLKPAVNNRQLAPPWCALLAQTYECYSQHDPIKCYLSLPTSFESVTSFLRSEAPNIRTSGAQCLVALISTSIKQQVIKDSSKPIKKATELLAKQTSGLLNARYQDCWIEISDILSAVLDHLGPAADPYLVESINIVGQLRSNDKFEGHNEAEKVLTAAIRAFGPERILEILPLNLLNPTSSEPGRAWLLPLLRDNIYRAKLSYFAKKLLPLTNQLSERASEGKPDSMENKIFLTLVDQIWSLLPRFCEFCTDLTKGLTPEFAQVLASNLYEAPQLRPVICRSLRLLVEPNLLVQQLHEEEGNESDSILASIYRPDLKEANKNIKFLSQNFAQTFLLVLSNVFFSTLPNERQVILECVSPFLMISEYPALIQTFDRMVAMLESSLKEERESREQHSNGNGDTKKKTTNNNSKGELPPTSHGLMDLIIAISPFLKDDRYQQLVDIFKTTAGSSNDAQLQKKAYKMISLLLEKLDSSLVEQVKIILVELKDSVAPPARGQRLLALCSAVNATSNEGSMSFIPEIISEAVMGTKEVNEKTREGAYELLVSMGNRMKQGGRLEFGGKVVDASLKEYFTMILPGLAGLTGHMISATVTALSRIMYDFHKDLDDNFLVELCSTVELFLTSPNREIVKSTLGFVKIEVISLPVDIFQPRLDELIPNLLRWSHEHKGHFKAKVKHIFERLIRRVGTDALESRFPEEDMKLLRNIRKTKDRASRKKLELPQSSESGEKESAKKSFSNEYDRALYSDSDEDMSGSDGEGDAGRKKLPNKTKAFLLENESEPMNLLDQISLAKGLTSGNNKQQRPRDARKDTNGKFVFDDDEDQKTSRNKKEQQRLATGGEAAAGDGESTTELKGQFIGKRPTKKRRKQYDSDEELVVDEDEEDVETSGRNQNNTKSSRFDSKRRRTGKPNFGGRGNTFRGKNRR